MLFGDTRLGERPHESILGFSLIKSIMNISHKHLTYAPLFLTNLLQTAKGTYDEQRQDMVWGVRSLDRKG
jgi:hypothetical protein